MSDILPIVFEDKVNSPELLAYLQQFGEENYVDAVLINKFRDGLNELYAQSGGSIILADEGFEIVDQDFIINEDWVWKILGEIKTNPDEISIPLPFSAAGKHRIDVIALNANNTAERVAGTEVDLAFSAFEPFAGINKIRLSAIPVNEDGYGDPSTPIVGENFIAKKEKLEIEDVSSGVIDFTFIDQRSVVVFIETVTEVESVEIHSESFYQNKKFTFKNYQATPITFKHSAGSNPFKFNFPSGEDFVLNPNEAIEFLGLKVVSPIFQFIGRDKINYDNLENLPDLALKADLVSGKVPASQLPSYVDDVIEFADYASLPVTGETSKIYVTIDNNKQYRWSGSAYVLLNLGITLTTKTTTSASLSTQDITGFLTYVNAVSSFAITANEIVKYHITDTGQIFEIRVNNRSVGTGQTALTSGDVLEVESAFATETSKGLVSSGTQTFGGNKTIVGTSSTVGNAFEVQNLSHVKVIQVGNDKTMTLLDGFIFKMVRSTTNVVDSPRFRFSGPNITTQDMYAEQGYIIFSAGLQVSGAQGLALNGGALNFSNQRGTQSLPLVTAGNGAKAGMFFVGSTLAHLAFCTDFLERLRISTTGEILIGTTTVEASSKLVISSTTQGSMPFPKMTSAQRTAISSPAVGLHVYQTDGTEGVYVNKSSGWAFAY